ncbi:MAG TPA: hypothetical protein GXZ27_03550 [Thermoanaerobacterales bacterium]|jgi:hypothetical protein|nr:hypothetical protein [Thermoanaerobacterales bacterium]
MKSSKKSDFDIKDIIAMIIAAFQLLLPPLFILFTIIIVLYFILKYFLKM